MLTVAVSGLWENKKFSPYVIVFFCTFEIHWSVLSKFSSIIIYFLKHKKNNSLHIKSVDSILQWSEYEEFLCENFVWECQIKLRSLAQIQCLWLSNSQGFTLLFFIWRKPWLWDLRKNQQNYVLLLKEESIR